MHTHTAGYHGVVVRGQFKHWPAGGEGRAQVVGPGSTWYEPGEPRQRVHDEVCVSAECLILLQFEGGFDFVPAQK